MTCTNGRSLSHAPEKKLVALLLGSASKDLSDSITGVYSDLLTFSTSICTLWYARHASHTGMSRILLGQSFDFFFLLQGVHVSLRALHQYMKLRKARAGHHAQA